DLSEQPANAVRVRAQVEVPTLMPFMQPRRVWAHAVANQDEPMAAFSIGSGLASLDDGLLNQVLGGLLGTSVSLDLVSYQGLATTSISVLEFLELLDVDASVGTLDQVLDTEVTVLQWVDAVITALDEREGLDIGLLRNAVLVSALQDVALRLGDVLALG